MKAARPAPAPALPPAAVAGAFLLCVMLSGCAGWRDRDAWLALTDLAAGAEPSRLKQSTAEPSRQALTYVVEGRNRTGDLYLPGEGNALAGIVLVPGIVPEGKDNEELVAFAKTLARLRFAVLTPEMSGYRELKIGLQHVREVADALRHISERQDCAPGGRAGIAAFSYAAGPALLAALEDDIRDRVRFVLAVGGYYDLRASIRFLTTGHFRENGTAQWLQPNEYGKLVFIRSAQDSLRSSADRSLFDAMVAARLREPGADVSSLAADLSPEGRSIYQLLSNTDTARHDELLAKLPPGVLATIDSLTLSSKPLSLLQARLILVHGKDDRLVPYTESLALAAALPPEQSQIFLIHRVLGHVDLRLSQVLSRRFWREELPDAGRLLRALSALLRERQAPAPAFASPSPDQTAFRQHIRFPDFRETGILAA